MISSSLCYATPLGVGVLVSEREPLRVQGLHVTSCPGLEG